MSPFSHVLTWSIFGSLAVAAVLCGTAKGQPSGRQPGPVALGAEHPFPGRAEAPSLEGGVGWINTSGPIDLADLKGKFVVLDFWTYCCINCMHILPELKKLERAYPNQVVVIGVHSGKFEAEQDSKNIADAVLRYEIEHPVVNDAERKIWDRYGIDSWPSLRIIDPEGHIIAGQSAEIEFEALDRFFKAAMPYYEQRGLLDRTPVRFDLESQRAKQTPLRFPGKVLADEASGRLFIADSNHNRIVITQLDGKLLDTVGSGVEGTADGDFTAAQFHHPQGMALRGETLYVADTENHLLRKVDLRGKKVVTIAGTGKQGRDGWPGMERMIAGETTQLPERFAGSPLKTALNSPWDLCIVGENLFIAMAGPHQIWRMPLDEAEIGVYAGNGREDIVDGPLLPREPYAAGFASFAQPSGLTTDGKVLYVADSEGSSIRAVPLDPTKRVATIVGTANRPQGRLFTFGDQDGRGDQVRLQHPLGVAYHDGLLFVADTYNNKIKVVDPAASSAKTFSGTGKAGRDGQPAEFDEPTGISYAAGNLFVADTNNHAIRVVDVKDGRKVGTLTIVGLEAPHTGGTPVPPKASSAANFPRATEIELLPQTVKARDGRIYLALRLRLPTGWKMNPLAPMPYLIEGQVAAGPVDRGALGKLGRIEKPSEDVEIPLGVTSASGDDVLKVSLSYYYCREGAEGLCKMGSVTWTVPIKLSADGTQSVPLEFNVK